MKYDYLVVGAGPFGCTIAERIANDLGRTVLVIDKRNHIGGNCYSEPDPQTGIEVHRYGTHIFHTSSREAWDYLSKFIELNGYHHQVLTTHRNRVYQMPINLETINTFYGRNFRPAEAREFIRSEIAREHIDVPSNLEEKAASLIGRPLYEAFIREYTIKQWRKDPRDLPPDIITRLPVRYTYAEDYFNDARWQGIPSDGFTAVFDRMLSSPRIHIELGTDYFDHHQEFSGVKKVIYTGPVDRFFNYIYGQLEWRSIELEKKIINLGDFQGTSVMNYADSDVKYTRIHEPRHLHPEREYVKDKTVIFYETSKDDPNDPYYPVNTIENNNKAEKYRLLAAKEKDVVIGGRLGNFSYYDIDKTVLAALECYRMRIASSA